MLPALLFRTKECLIFKKASMLFQIRLRMLPNVVDRTKGLKTRLQIKLVAYVFLCFLNTIRDPYKCVRVFILGLRIAFYSDSSSYTRLPLHNIS